jgi:hypothetical protein
LASRDKIKILKENTPSLNEGLPADGTIQGDRPKPTVPTSIFKN